MRLAEMMRLHLAVNNLDQKQVAKEIGINESTLCRFLTGKGTPDAAGFMKILAWVTSEEVE